MRYMDWVRDEFRKRDAQLDAVYYCPHHPLHGVGDYLRDCDCRKPKAGMILAAQREWNIDLPRSLLIGDTPGDMEAGEAAGVGSCLIARTVLGSSSGRTSLEPVFVHGVLGLLDVRPSLL